MSYTKAELREKLENLERLRLDLQRQKKASNKDYNDQIKECQDEIEECIELIDQINTENS